jgi:hypothetical protein
MGYSWDTNIDTSNAAYRRDSYCEFHGRMWHAHYSRILAGRFHVNTVWVIIDLEKCRIAAKVQLAKHKGEISKLRIYHDYIDHRKTLALVQIKERVGALQKHVRATLAVGILQHEKNIFTMQVWKDLASYTRGSVKMTYDSGNFRFVLLRRTADIVLFDMEHSYVSFYTFASNYSERFKLTPKGIPKSLYFLRILQEWIDEVMFLFAQNNGSKTSYFLSIFLPCNFNSSRVIRLFLEFKQSRFYIPFVMADQKGTLFSGIKRGYITMYRHVPGFFSSQD